MARIALNLFIREVHRPVEPKPPIPRCVSSSSSTSSNCALSAGAEPTAQSFRRDGSETVRFQIRENDLHFAAIVVVDRSGRIETCDPMLESETRSWSNLNFVTFGNCDCKTSRNRVALAWTEDPVFRSDDIKPGCPGGRIGWQGQALARRKPFDQDLDHLDFFRFARPPFLGGPFEARSSIRRMASSSPTSLGSVPFGRVALVVPSVA